MYCTRVRCAAHAAHGRGDLGVWTLDVQHAPHCRPNRELHLVNKMKEDMRRLAAATGRPEQSFREVESRPE